MNPQVALQSAERFIALPNSSAVSLLSIETHDGRAAMILSIEIFMRGLPRFDAYPLFTIVLRVVVLYITSP